MSTELACGLSLPPPGLDTNTISPSGSPWLLFPVQHNPHPTRSPQGRHGKCSEDGQTYSMCPPCSSESIPGLLLCLLLYCYKLSSIRTQSADLPAALAHSESRGWAPCHVSAPDHVDKPVKGTAHSQHCIRLPRSPPAQGMASEFPDGLQGLALTGVSFHPAICVRRQSPPSKIRDAACLCPCSLGWLLWGPTLPLTVEPVASLGAEDQSEAVSGFPLARTPHGACTQVLLMGVPLVLGLTPTGVLSSKPP